MFVDWSSCNVCVVIASFMGTTELASQVLLYHLAQLFFQVPIGLSQASTALVGNEIGAGNVPKGKSVYWTITKFSVFINLAYFCVLKSTHHYYTRWFTPNPDVLTETNRVVWTMLIGFVIDFHQNVQLGTIKALAQQNKAFRVNMVTYFVIALPLIFYVHVNVYAGLEGLWLSFMVAWSYQSVAYMLIIRFTDWDQVAKEAAVRNGKADGTYVEFA